MTNGMYLQIESPKGMDFCPYRANIHNQTSTTQGAATLALGYGQPLGFQPDREVRDYFVNLKDFVKQIHQVISTTA